MTCFAYTCTAEVHLHPVSICMKMRIHLPLLLLLALHLLGQDAHEEDYGHGDADDVYLHSEESDEASRKIKAKKKEEELEEMKEKKRKKFFEIISYIQSKEQEMEAIVRKGHKKYEEILSYIAQLIKDKKYMDFSIPQKVGSKHAIVFYSCPHFRLVPSMRRHHLQTSTRNLIRFSEYVIIFLL